MSSTKKPKLIVILGYTGSGKSELGVQLAKNFHGEIISADSRQVYQEMNVGTGKILGKWKNDKYIYKNIPHYLIDFLSPAKTYSVGEYKQQADKLIEGISYRHKTVFIVGGTAQYIYSVVDNWQIPKVAPNEKFRKKYEKIIQKKGLDFIWQELIKKDPGAAEFVQKEAPRRIIRALEVINATGERFSKLRVKKPSKYDILLIGISYKNVPIQVGDYERKELYNNIDQRVDQMIDTGLEKEVKKLVKKYGASAPGLQSIGYQEFVPYFDKEIALDDVIQKIKFNTHRYVRYQNNWFNKDKGIKWIKSFEQARELVKIFLA